MSDNISQERSAVSAPVHAPWGALVGLNPVQEYGVLAHELQECFPDAACLFVYLCLRRAVRHAFESMVTHQEIRLELQSRADIRQRTAGDDCNRHVA